MSVLWKFLLLLSFGTRPRGPNELGRRLLRTKSCATFGLAVSVLCKVDLNIGAAIAGFLGLRRLTLGPVLVVFLGPIRAGDAPLASCSANPNGWVWVTSVLRKHQHHQRLWVKVSKSYLEHPRSPTNSLRRSGTDKLYVGQTYSQLRLVD